MTQTRAYARLVIIEHLSWVSRRSHLCGGYRRKRMAQPCPRAVHIQRPWEDKTSMTSVMTVWRIDGQTL